MESISNEDAGLGCLGLHNHGFAKEVIVGPYQLLFIKLYLNPNFNDHDHANSVSTFKHDIATPQFSGKPLHKRQSLPTSKHVKDLND